VLVQQYAAVTGICFSASTPHDFAVASSTRVLVYEASSNSVKRTLSRFTNIVYGISLRFDGRVVLAGGEEAVVRLCDVNSREILRTLHGHTSAVRATTFFGDSSALSAGDDGYNREYEK
jgi:U3 small nucleolar RNA-associated protein 15